jgi:hypothetical protein
MPEERHLGRARTAGSGLLIARASRFRIREGLQRVRDRGVPPPAAVL